MDKETSEEKLAQVELTWLQRRFFPFFGGWREIRKVQAGAGGDDADLVKKEDELAFIKELAQNGEPPVRAKSVCKKD